jgi:Zn-dependent protease/CBS domain-containing protein
VRGSFRLGRIAGIEIGIHYSWILIFVLVTTSLALGLFRVALPNLNTATYWAAGVLAALLLFFSVLLHELAHSLVAQARGMKVRSITLFILGGVSNLEEEAEKPLTEFSMAIVGPGTSLILAFVFWIVYSAIQASPTTNPLVFPSDRYENIYAAILHYLAFINGLLAAFNILPGFPLDGGRVLRSIIWGATGNIVRATNIAATVGRLFGWGFIAVGVFWVFSGNLIGGIWIAFIGWFLSNAADASRQEITLREYLTGARVKDAMYQNQETISPRTTVADLVQGVFNQRYRRAVPVCDNDRTVGIVTITDVKGLAQEKWPYTPVEQIMTRQPLHTVSPEDDLNKALKLIAQHDLNQVLVMNDGGCVGLLSRAEIIRYLQLAQELKVKGK